MAAWAVRDGGCTAGLDEVNLAKLREAGLVPTQTRKAKIILSGEISEAVHTRGLAFTKGARAAVEAAGGKIEE